MAKVVSYGTRPKRRIEQVYNHGITQISTGVQTLVLHTAEDPSTVVRIVGRIKFHLSAPTPTAGTVFKCPWIIQVEPQGTRIQTPTTGNIADEVKTRTVIQEGLCTIMGTGVFAENGNLTDLFEIDIKGMRKLNQGDELTLTLSPRTLMVLSCPTI